MGNLTLIMFNNMKYIKNIKEGKFDINLAELDSGQVLLELVSKDGSFYYKKTGENYFIILQELRIDLEKDGVDLLCNGSSVDVYPSAMQLSMGGGDKAYRLKMGFHTQMNDIVDIFDYDEDKFVKGTVAEQTEFYKRWVLSKKKLKVDQPKYSINNIDVVNGGFVFFWGHQSNKDNIGKSCLSQWWPCKFEKDSIKYNSAEQWMMAEKARLFADFDVLEQVLKLNDPKKIKSLGRQVSFFDEDVWNFRSYDIVKEGNFLKFSQNPELKKYLLSTENKILVEASPVDTIWGIGMKQNDDGVEDSMNWKGQNLLGFALMEVRDRLRT